MREDCDSKETVACLACAQASHWGAVSGALLLPSLGQDKKHLVAPICLWTPIAIWVTHWRKMSYSPNSSDHLFFPIKSVFLPTPFLSAHPDDLI